MPRGGYRPGAGAKPGNTNALKHGRASDRSLMLIRLFNAHPNRREIVRHLYLEGILDLDHPPTDADAVPDSPTARRLLRFLDTVFFDRTHPLFHQINGK